jgi:hypothetical protein
MVQPQDQIDRELGAAAVADLADMKAPRKQRVEHGRNVLGGLLIAANETDAVALADLFARSRHRRFEETNVRRGEPLAQRLDPVRIAGAGAEHHGPHRHRRQQRALHHLLDLISAEHRECDHPARRNLGGRGRGRAAPRHKTSVLPRVDVVALDAKACGHQPPSQHLAHQAKADYSHRFSCHCGPFCTRCHVSVNARHWQRLSPGNSLR